MENGHHRKAENKLYQGTNHYTTHQMHILKQNDYYKRKAQVLIIAVCISLHVVEIQLEAACSFTSALFEIFANFVLAIAFKKVIATEQKLPSVSTANGTIDCEWNY